MGTMATTLPNTFPQFSLLPAEIQLQIWESTSATLPTRQMHIFDVQAPPPQPQPKPQAPTTTTSLHGPPNAPRRNPSHRRTRSQSPHAKATLPLKRIRKSTSPPRRSAAITTTTNLSTLPTVSLTSFSTSIGDKGDSINSRSSSSSSNDHGFDPSGYKFRDVLRATCVDAANTVRYAEARIPAADRALIELPSGRQLVYDNALDVLHLRFLVGSSSGAGASPLSDIFQSMWSPALATALHSARRVAIDVSQIWPELAQQQHKLVQDIVFLVCTLQNNLEVLYLVDYSQQQQQGSAAAAAAAAGATSTTKDSELYARFHSYYGPAWEAEKDRPADVIHGNGTVWREVFDFERLGWHERHPGFVFGEMFGEVVRLQQGQWFGEGEKKATFQGVRVLVAESETVVDEVENDLMDES